MRNHVRRAAIAAALTWVAPAVAQAAASANGPRPCHLGSNPPLVLYYSSLGASADESLVAGCPGEVVIGEKRRVPPSTLRSPAFHAAGGRVGYVYSDNGREIRDLLETQGVGGAVADVKAKLAAGYDYVVIDEITADVNWADGATVNRRFRKMLGRLPRGKVIAYISLDLTMEAGGAEAMRHRRLLLRALRQRGRALALEVYLHTGQAMLGESHDLFERAADRLANAVQGLHDCSNINAHAISVIGMSIHSSPFPQYHYLDEPAHDFSSVRRQIHALRHGSARLEKQRGVGFYFVGSSDLDPLHGAPYRFDDVVSLMHHQSEHWR